MKEFLVEIFTILDSATRNSFTILDSDENRPTFPNERDFHILV